eukprot:4271923-Prymnesium_polylepis.1
MNIGHVPRAGCRVTAREVGEEVRRLCGGRRSCSQSEGGRCSPAPRGCGQKSRPGSRVAGRAQ